MIDQDRTTSEKVAQYRNLEPLFSSMYAEIQTLCKKKPDATLNRMKVDMINKLLTGVQDLLEKEEAKDFLYLLDQESLPQYSDVVLILSQYEASLKKFMRKYHGRDFITNEYNVWRTEEGAHEYEEDDADYEEDDSED